VAGSASLKGQALFLTLTNSHAQEATEVTVDILGGAKVNQAHGEVLAGEIRAHNTFNSPTQVTPQVLDVSCEPSRLNLTLHPASISAIQIQLS
jgi:alpha-L-arabinofuranosidase